MHPQNHSNEKPTNPLCTGNLGRKAEPRRASRVPSKVEWGSWPQFFTHSSPSIWGSRKNRYLELVAKIHVGKKRTARVLVANERFWPNVWSPRCWLPTVYSGIRRAIKRKDSILPDFGLLFRWRRLRRAFPDIDPDHAMVRCIHQFRIDFLQLRLGRPVDSTRQNFKIL